MSNVIHTWNEDTMLDLSLLGKHIPFGQFFSAPPSSRPARQAEYVGDCPSCGLPIMRTDIGKIIRYGFCRRCGALLEAHAFNLGQRAQRDPLPATAGST